MYGIIPFTSVKKATKKKKVNETIGWYQNIKKVCISLWKVYKDINNPTDTYPINTQVQTG